mgnify:CR=1 FL=1
MTFALDSSLRERWRPDGTRFLANFPEGWSQGRSVFGGVTAAMAVALGSKLAEGRELRTVSIHLVRPTLAGEVQGEVALIRAGRNVSFIEVRLLQKEVECARATLVFVVPNPEALHIPAPLRVPTTSPDTLPAMPRNSALIPEFVQHVEMRWLSGYPPFSGAEDGDFTGYCRFVGPAGGPEGLVALLDVWPAPPLSMLTRPAPASTVSWTAHLIGVPESLDDWSYYSYKTVAGEGGYHTCAGRLYDAQGSLLAYSEQLVALYG